MDVGTVTKENVAYWTTRFPYDGVIHLPNTCKECDLPRPARAKHCELCGVCQARFDHHCPWLNTCVAAHSLKYFVAFLLSTAVLCAYCTYLSIWVLLQFMESDELKPAKWAKMADPASLPFLSRCLLAFGQRLPIGLLGIFTLVVSLVLFGFAGYHFSLMGENNTTYEDFKFGRYHNTGSLAVRYAGQMLKKAGLPFTAKCANVSDCLQLARECVDAFDLDVRIPGEVQEVDASMRKRPNVNGLQERAARREGIDLAKFERCVTILTKYNPEAHNAYGEKQSWWANVKEALEWN